ncbi:hypothetical protein ACRAWG_07100 [Methylobacterium sp. P31]
MHLLFRIIMAGSLIMADAAQAASLTEAHGERQAANERAASYQARFKNMLDRDEKTWRRLSASICTGCGSPPPPLEIAKATPLYLRAQRAVEVGTPGPETTASASAAQPAATQSAARQEHREGRSRVVRSTRSSVRLTARARRHARYARLRLIRHERRLALLRAQKRRHALLASRARHHAHRVELAALGFGASQREAPPSGDQRRPVPLPPPRPDMLCADDRGLAAAGGASASACVGAQ